jgi:hypothetical protein
MKLTDEELRTRTIPETEYQKLLLRAGRVPVFAYSTPVKFRHNGASSAYSCAFESGYRGYEFENPYSRTDCREAYSSGYLAGIDALNEAARNAERKGKAA